MAPPNVTGSEESSYRIVPTSTSEEDFKRESDDIVDSMPKIKPSDTGEENDPLTEKLEEEEDPELVVPPDGGWGWVVVFASFMCNMIVDGIIFSFGEFMDGISKEFVGSTKTQVALVGSLMSGFYLLTGPFASALSNRYGFQLVAVIGSIIGAAMFALSYFATSVSFLCVSYGVLGGIGFGFIYVPSVITVGFYFERWRAIATGIAVCGSGIGAFLMIPISQYMIATLGWRKALLCEGAIVIMCVIFGFAFKPIKPTKLPVEKELIMDPSKLPPGARLKMEEALRVMKRDSITPDHQTSFSKMLGVNNNSEYPRVSDVYHTISIPSRKVLEIYSAEKRLSVPFISDKDKPKGNLLTVQNAPRLIPRRQRTSSENESEVNRPMYREDILYGASLARLPQWTSQTSFSYNLSVTRVPTKNDIEEEKKKTCKLCPEAVRRTLATMLDYSLLKSPSFLILALGGFLTMMGFYIPFMYLSDRVRTAPDYGWDDKSAAFLVSSIGIANTIGRILCGVISSLPGVDALMITNIALSIGGVATICSGVSMSTECQFVYTIIFGLSVSCFASLRSIIVVDLLGLDKLTNAFGLLLLFQGVAAIIGSPLAGAFMEATGSYDYSFYLSGTFILASAIICYPLNYINKWERRKNSRTNQVAV